MIQVPSDLAIALDGVEGWFALDEAALLHELAAQVPAGQCIVEIGSYHGRSTIALAMGAPDGVLVYAVDPHDTHMAGGFPFGMVDNQRFMENISGAGLGHKVRVLNLPSGIAITAWRQAQYPIGLLFIDGGHEFEDVDSDVHFWQKHLVVGGFLAIHDSTGGWVAPTQIADELARTRGWTEGAKAGYTRTFRKDAP